MHKMKFMTPSPVAFTAVSSSNLQTRLDASTLSASLAVRVLKADGTSVAGGGTGGIAHGITQPDVTNAPGCCYYTPVAADINVLGVAIIRISATGMEPREIPVDIVSDPGPVAAVVAGTLTSTSFSTNLGIASGQLANEAHLRFLGNVTAALAGQVQKITGYAGGVCSFATGFSTAPAAGDLFVIVNG